MLQYTLYCQRAFNTFNILIYLCFLNDPTFFILSGNVLGISLSSLAVCGADVYEREYAMDEKSAEIASGREMRYVIDYMRGGGRDNETDLILLILRLSHRNDC